MPIEIKELHIKIDVDSQSKTNKSGLVNKKEITDLMRSCIEEVHTVESRKKER